MAFFEDISGSIIRAEPHEFGLSIAALVAIALFSFWAAFNNLRRARVIEDTPTSRIRSAAQGFLELQGVAELMDGQPILAPLTGTRCAWYRYKIEKHQRSGKSRNWVVKEQGTSDELFLLRDDTGECVVDPEGAKVTPSGKDIWYGDSERPVGGPAGAQRWFGGNRYRYSEWRILAGDPLYAIGYFHTQSSAADMPSTAAEVRELLREWKRDAAAMRQFDANGDGQIDMQEWDAAQQAARKLVVAAQHERATEPGVDLLRQPDNRQQPYLLSVLPESDMVRRFHWIVRGSMVAFFLCGIAAVWAMKVRFGA
jgi:hypothetical protein